MKKRILLKIDNDLLERFNQAWNNADYSFLEYDLTNAMYNRLTNEIIIFDQEEVKDGCEKESDKTREKKYSAEHYTGTGETGYIRTRDSNPNHNN